MSQNQASPTEMYIGQVFEIVGMIFLLGKKIQCCPPAQRVGLMGAVLQAATNFSLEPPPKTGAQ